jgi:16S rRNA (adenine1518-N6/adenine1519-N6)-dimethyltransferase
MDWAAWSEAVFMVQKEVAERIAAEPGSRDYGILSLAVQGKASVEKLFDVPPGAFTPAPKVMSTVFKLTRLKKSLLFNEETFFKVVHAAFGQRRKTLLNSLSHGLGREKPEVETALRNLGIDPTRRAETLSLDDFNRLSEVL